MSIAVTSKNQVGTKPELSNFFAMPNKDLVILWGDQGELFAKAANPLISWYHLKCWNTILPVFNTKIKSIEKIWTISAQGKIKLDLGVGVRRSSSGLQTPDFGKFSLKNLQFWHRVPKTCEKFSVCWKSWPTGVEVVFFKFDIQRRKLEKILASVGTRRHLLDPSGPVRTRKKLSGSFWRRISKPDFIFNVRTKRKHL